MKHNHLLSNLRYEPETGLFFWAAARPKVRVGDQAGYTKKDRGYIYIEFDQKSYAAHRLAWFYMTKKWPSDQIDHINGNKSDNRFANLREATNGQNRANTKTSGKHGLKGVKFLPWIKNGGKCWQSQITHNKKVIYLGCYHTKEEAHEAYVKKAIEFHGDFHRR